MSRIFLLFAVLLAACAQPQPVTNSPTSPALSVEGVPFLDGSARAALVEIIYPQANGVPTRDLLFVAAQGVDPCTAVKTEQDQFAAADRSRLGDTFPTLSAAERCSVTRDLALERWSDRDGGDITWFQLHRNLVHALPADVSGVPFALSPMAFGSVGQVEASAFEDLQAVDCAAADATGALAGQHETPVSGQVTWTDRGDGRWHVLFEDLDFNLGAAGRIEGEVPHCTVMFDQ